MSRNRLEALHAAADVGFGDVEIALGIHRDGMAMREVADLVSGAAEGGRDLAKEIGQTWPMAFPPGLRINVRYAIHEQEDRIKHSAGSNGSVRFFVDMKRS